MSAALAPQSYEYPELEAEIHALRSFAEPLQDEVKVTPLLDVISRILNLQEDLSDVEPHEIFRIEREVRECQRILEGFSYEYVNRIISKPDPSRVFKILANANKFERALKRSVGKTLKMEDGTELPLTKEIAEALTSYRFSIGTPPITPGGIDTIERILFGGNLGDIYGFRDLLGVNRVKFDRFLQLASNLVEESTHYTTADEKRQFEREATEFQKLKGNRGLKKAVVTGTPRTAVRLISEHMMKQHGNGSQPLKVIEEPDQLNDALIRDMRAQKDTIFVVRVTKVSHNVFTNDKLHSKWEGLLGRLILVDDSENARKSGTTLVYTLQPKIADAISQFHVKDSGTPANTQMNLRRILERSSPEDIAEMTAAVDAKIAEMRKEGVHVMDASKIRKQEWMVGQQKDFASLIKFKQFLTFITRIKNGDDAALAKLEGELTAEAAKLTREYFFSKINKERNKVLCIPQGGGRKEIGLVGKFHLLKHNQRVEAFKGSAQGLSSSKAKLERLKQAQGISTTYTAQAAIEQATMLRRSPEAAIRDASGEVPTHTDAIAHIIEEAIHGASQGVESRARQIREAVETLTAANPTGHARAKAKALLTKLGIGELAKNLEGGPWLSAANKVKGLAGLARRAVGGTLGAIEREARSVRMESEPKNLTLATKILNDIENGTFRPALALAEVGWTFNDVLDPDDYPEGNYLKISMHPTGQLDPYSLEKQLHKIQGELVDFPELFELYCGSIILINNDPHNPTSTVEENKVKIKFLEVASQYKLTVLSDAAYHKNISPEKKDVQSDPTLAQFEEEHAPALPNGPTTMYTSLPTTKWAMGAGRRTGVVVSSDKSTITVPVLGSTPKPGEPIKTEEIDFEEFVKRETDSVNTMSLHMDIESIRTGKQVKDVSKALRESLKPLIGNDAEDVIEELLSSADYADINSDKFSAPIYFALIRARNDLDRLKLRTRTPEGYAQARREYINGFLKDLKDLRLEKRTQRDVQKRAGAIMAAIDEVDEKHPGIKQKCIQPEGPFYVCVMLAENEAERIHLQPFLMRIAAARKIELAPIAKGYVRLAFGGEVDGTKEGYNLLKIRAKVDLSLLIEYWEKFKALRIEKKECLNPEQEALNELFPGGEEALAQTCIDKEELIEAHMAYKKKGKGSLTAQRPANVEKYISSIEPSSKHHIVTLRKVECETAEEMVQSKPFRDLFNFYLLKIKDQIPALKFLEDEDIKAHFGASRFADAFCGARNFTRAQEKIYAKIVFEVAKIWFSDDTIKVFAESEEDTKGASGDLKDRGLRGAEDKLSAHIQRFIKAFLTREQEEQLLAILKKRRRAKDETVETRHKRTFQVGYEAKRGVKPNAALPQCVQNVIGKSEFAGKTTPTDPSQRITTGGTARVAGEDMAISRRDGDGEGAPDAEFFSDRLSKFSEVMDPKDYVAKMVQVGGTQVLLVMSRAYSQYLAEELRLFPQFEMELDEIDGSIRPDAVSFLGIPTKVMGENYRIGYYMDKCDDGREIPISWVDGENITDYMGYLKKPILTVANEVVKKKEMLPIHGSAFTVIFKNGLRKTIVMGGDSGTGKSETIIAMKEQIMKQIGAAEEVADVELLAGDMLSLFEGDDGQLYMLGTESGDFMRTTDISDYWEGKNRDLEEFGAWSNINDPTNPRITIPGICDPEKLLRPTRVNMFFNINNYRALTRGGREIEESEDPSNLLLESYIEGSRGEKGTSGDQPNLFISLRESGRTDIAAALRYQRELDKILGWEVQVDERGKAANAILNFNDVEGGIHQAHDMAKALFVGKQYQTKDKKGKVTGSYEILGVEYDPISNRFSAVIKDLDQKEEEPITGNGPRAIAARIRKRAEKAKERFRPKNKTILLDRETVFKNIYTPTAATPGGQPFVEPQGMDEGLSRFAQVMRNAGVITGIINTQLKVKHMENEGPARAAQELIRFILRDPRITERYDKQLRVVSHALTSKYGERLTGATAESGAIPTAIMAYNLGRYERHDSDSVRPVKAAKHPGQAMADRETIDLKTPYYKYDPNARKAKGKDGAKGKDEKGDDENYFPASLITPPIARAIREICEDEEHALIPLNQEIFRLKDYKDIQAWDSKEELIYQVMMLHGVARPGYTPAEIEKWPTEIKTAEKAADLIIGKAHEGIAHIRQVDGYSSIEPIEDPENANLSAYQNITSWESDDDLIYQIMLANEAQGLVKINYQDHAASVKYAEEISEAIKAKSTAKAA